MFQYTMNILKILMKIKHILKSVTKYKRDTQETHEQKQYQFV